MVARRKDPLLEKAIRQLERVKRTLAGLDIQFRDLGRDVFGVGVRITGNDDNVMVLSVPGPADNVLNITVGVLKDVSHQRLQLLELCNGLTRDNVAAPVYLHDAPDGCDVHVQQRYLIDLIEEAPWFLKLCVENLLAMAETTRAKFQAAGIRGDLYHRDTADVQRLLIRSLI